MAKNPCSFICENKKVGYTCIVILFLLGLGCIIQLFLVVPAVENAFYDEIESRIVMTSEKQNDRDEDYLDWISNNNTDAPIQLFEYWIYNVTNPEDVPNGAYPQFDLIGPFKFRRYEIRTGPGGYGEPIFYEKEEEYKELDIEVDDPVVEFEYQYSFEYLEEESVDISLDEMIHVVSGAIQGYFRLVLTTYGSDPFSALPCVDDALKTFPGTAVFANIPIYDLFYGFRDYWVETVLDQFCCPNGPPCGILWDALKPNTLFGLLADGDNHVYQHTGKNNVNRVAELERYRNWTFPEENSWKAGQTDLWCPAWLKLELGGVLECPQEIIDAASVTGSRETRNFPPRNWIDENRELLVWSIEKFRPTVYKYQKEVTYKGVDLMRFVIDEEELKACTYEYFPECSESPTPNPTPSPTSPTEQPTTAQPTMQTDSPTMNPTVSPTLEPTIDLSDPTADPTTEPTIEPTEDPTRDPTATLSPSENPTKDPTIEPTTTTDAPTDSPTPTPTEVTDSPSPAPTETPTCVYEVASPTCKFFQFWYDEEGNPVDGVANLTGLRGSPSFMSKGRFLDAPFFQKDTNEAFNLSQPEPDEDDQFFDVDPRSGIVFRNFHNYQMNFKWIEMKRPYPTNFTNFTIFNKLVPMAYVRVEALATDDQMEFYKDTLDTIDLINGFSLYGGPALAVIFFGFMFLILCKMRRGGPQSADGIYGRLVEENGAHGENGVISMQQKEYGSTTKGDNLEKA